MLDPQVCSIRHQLLLMFVVDENFMMDGCAWMGMLNRKSCYRRLAGPAGVCLFESFLPIVLCRYMAPALLALRFGLDAIDEGELHFEAIV